MQTSREVIRNTLAFNNPDRLGFNFPEPHGSDFFEAGMSPSPDNRPSWQGGVDEWGVEWENLGISALGEVKKSPLETWDDFSRLRVPDVRDPRRFENIRGLRKKTGEKFLLGWGVSLYTRVLFIRGTENTWCDIYENPGKLGALVDILADMNLHAIEEYAREGFDGFMSGDDWGLQERLMISPEKWREIWKPRYAKIYARARELGLKTMLHSCGNIMEILDDLIEIGLDAINMDQQENMGLDVLGKRFAGRVTFYNPVDIQTILPRGEPAEIRAYCRRMVKHLSTPAGGFIARWYSDPKGAGHNADAVNIMCEEFLKISREMYG